MAPEPQVVLVTGCSQGGIGYELCKAFHAAGCRVFASARKIEAMSGLPELGIYPLKLDVTSAESRKAAVDEVIAEAGRIDILVNNAGMGMPGAIVEQDLDAVRALFDANYFGLLGRLGHPTVQCRADAAEHALRHLSRSITHNTVMLQSPCAQMLQGCSVTARIASITPSILHVRQAVTHPREHASHNDA